MDKGEIYQNQNLFSESFLLTKIGRKITQLYEDRLKKELDITPIQSGILYLSFLHDGLIDSKSLVEALFVDKAYMSRSIGLLEERGLIYLKKDVKDERKKNIHLKTSGYKMIKNIKQIDETINNEFILTLSKDFKGSIIQYLKKTLI